MKASDFLRDDFIELCQIRELQNEIGLYFYNSRDKELLFCFITFLSFVTSGVSFQIIKVNDYGKFIIIGFL